MTEEWFGELIERRTHEAATDFCYMLHIFRKSDGKAIGYCDITPHFRQDYQYGRIGYTIHNSYWGNGYATACVKALVKIGFNDLKLHRLEAHISLDNDISKHVVCNAGFEFEGIRKGFIWEDGAWTDNEVYYIVNGEPLYNERITCFGDKETTDQY